MILKQILQKSLTSNMLYNKNVKIHIHRQKNWKSVGKRFILQFYFVFLKSDENERALEEKNKKEREREEQYRINLQKDIVERAKFF